MSCSIVRSWPVRVMTLLSSLGVIGWYSEAAAGRANGAAATRARRARRSFLGTADTCDTSMRNLGVAGGGCSQPAFGPTSRQRSGVEAPRIRVAHKRSSDRRVRALRGTSGIRYERHFRAQGLPRGGGRLAKFPPRVLRLAYVQPQTRFEKIMRQQVHRRADSLARTLCLDEGLPLQVFNSADDCAAKWRYRVGQGLNLLLERDRCVAREMARCGGQHVRGFDDREKRAAEAIDAQHHRHVHVGYADDEVLQLVGHRVGVPVGVRNDVAVLAVTMGAALDVELHHLRGAELPRVLRAEAYMNGRVVIRRVGLEQYGVVERGPFVPRGGLANGGGAQALRVLNDACCIGFEEVTAFD